MSTDAVRSVPNRLGALVGRDRQITLAERSLDEALAGRGGVLLVCGEPGIGKTRLAAEVAAIAQARGVPAAWGRCVDEEGVPAFWPWRRVLTAVLSDRPADDLLGTLGPLAEPVRALLDPGPHASQPGGTPSAAAGRQERFRLFAGVSALLVSAATRAGLVVVVDDLQWADRESGLLLTHLAREVRSSRLLVVVTVREEELEERPGLAAALAGLSGEPGMTRIRLDGLAEADVGQHLRAVYTGPVQDAAVAAVARRTGGNPFFIGELGRLLDDLSQAGRLRAETWETALPDGVQAVVAQRLDRLSAECRELLRTASVLGASIDVAALASVCSRPTAEVISVFEPALRASLLVAASTMARLEFAHGLIRDTLCQEVPAAQRLEIHRVAAQRLESYYGNDVDRHGAELAHHWLSSLPAGDAKRAVAWAARAAAEAVQGFGYQQAAALYARALDAAELAGLGPAERCRLLIGQAQALLKAGDVIPAIRAATDAVREAQRSGDPLAMADAALSLEGVADDEWGRQVSRLGEQAVRSLPRGQLERRARVMAAMASAVSYSMIASDVHRRNTLSRDALTLAEASNTPAALVSALTARNLARADPEGVHDRLDVANRMLALAARTGDEWTELWGRLWSIDANCQLGETDMAESELECVAQVCGRLRIPLADWHLARTRCAISIGRGRFADAYRYLDQAVSLGGQLDVRAQQGYAITAIVLSALTGEPVAGQLISDLENRPSLPTRVLLVWFYAVSGDMDRAASVYRSLPPWRVWHLPPFVTLVAHFTGARAAAMLQRTDDAAYARQQLQPWVDYIAVTSSGLQIIHGSLHLPAGEAATCTGDDEGARHHLRAAITANERAGLPPYVAEAQYALAALLATSGNTADRHEARALADSARRAAAGFGMRPVQARAESLVAALSVGHPRAQLSRREREIAELVAQALTNRQIAGTLHIAERTAENHVQHILTKLGFQRRSQIAVWVTRHSDRDQTHP